MNRCGADGAVERVGSMAFEAEQGGSFLSGGLGVVAILALFGAATASAVEPPADGFHATPSLYWQQSPHRIDLGFEVRARPEWWSAYSDRMDLYEGTRARARFQYSYEQLFQLVAEAQLVNVGSMDPLGTGALASYRNANGGREDVTALQLRRLYAELRPAEGAFARLGRQEMKLGAEVAYTEPAWKYLKTARLGERLLGGVEWSFVGRGGDGFAGAWDFGRYQANLFAAQPTTGVFAVEDGYQHLKDILYGGAVATVKRDTWVTNTEFSFFGMGYGDDRPVKRGGLPGGVEVGTLGASALGVYSLGPGSFDALLWVAGQFGDYDDLDQSGAAGLAEFGYQLTGAFAKPWLRAGVNVASGDGDPSDGDHDTFFNLLPTNHMYYGYADQLAFQNLVDTFVQLRLFPHPMLALNLFVHWFGLTENEDARYAGSGAFDHDTFGFTAQESHGDGDIGVEYDIVATITPHENITVEAGFAYLDGGDFYPAGSDRDVHFGYLSVELRY
jgi:hypothetical protein